MTEVGLPQKNAKDAKPQVVWVSHLFCGSLRLFAAIKKMRAVRAGSVGAIGGAVVSEVNLSYIFWLMAVTL